LKDEYRLTLREIKLYSKVVCAHPNDANNLHAAENNSIRWYCEIWRCCCEL